MKMVKIFIGALLITLCFGCAGKDRVYEGMYNGFQSMERLKNDERPYPPPGEEPMNYQQYKKEREKILNSNNSNNNNNNSNNSNNNNNSNNK